MAPRGKKRPAPSEEKEADDHPDPKDAVPAPKDEQAAPPPAKRARAGKSRAVAKSRKGKGDTEEGGHEQAEEEPKAEEAQADKADEQPAVDAAAGTSSHEPAPAAANAAAEATTSHEPAPVAEAATTSAQPAAAASDAGEQDVKDEAEMEEDEKEEKKEEDEEEEKARNRPAKRARKVAAKAKPRQAKPKAAKAEKKPPAKVAEQVAPLPPRHGRAPAAIKPAVLSRSKAGLAAAALAAAGFDVFTFGSSDFGALGLGEDTKERFRPAHVELPAGERALQVACGGVHTAVLSTSGNVYTFGVNDEGALGRPTEGTPWKDRPDAKEDDCTPGRMRLPSGVVGKQVAAGDGITLVLAEDGSVWGCGCFKDELGGHDGFAPGGVRLVSLPMCVWRPTSVRDKGVKLVCGARHAVLLTARGTVYTWGVGTQGQLGRLPQFDVNSLPEPDELFTPKDVTLGVVAAIGSNPVADIAAGAYSTFVVNKLGDVAAAGLNNSGQLGIPKEGDEDNIKWDFEQVEALSKVTSVEGGEYHSLALTRGGTLLSFGAPSYGCLGREGLDLATNNACHPKPEPVAGLEGQHVTSLAAGQHVSACITEDGGAWLWGSNNTFQLARGDDDSNVPVPDKLKRTKAFGFRKIYKVSFGGQHAALLAGLPEEPAAAAAPAATAPAKGADGPASKADAAKADGSVPAGGKDAAAAPTKEEKGEGAGGSQAKGG